MSRHTSIPCSARGRDQRAEVLVGAQLGVDRVVAARLVADRVRAAGVAGLGRQRVVAALAVGVADRVDRRHVEDVEAELGEPRELLLDALEAAPRAREELVPGAEARERAVDVDLERRGQLGRLGALLRPIRRARAAPGRAPRADRWRSPRRPPPGGALVLALGARRRRPEQDRALAELAAEVGLAELDLARELVAPAGEQVDPGLDRPLPARPASSTVKAPSQRTP